ncbi:hypothetical protein RT723_09765 [Psychrosphaera aquimarina]|uniref:Uncharacterized protein n=1 Tax=Psychrosphaera aquimarina TaxID=2044854 RepID=A0ABU3R0R8_9GAMM|nr:hypothetical protein [Psychrosphaera aquimarina]MDU0113275.1 hypothetical protein [Psychrosphaera aquimarina]
MDPKEDLQNGFIDILYFIKNNVDFFESDGDINLRHQVNNFPIFLSKSLINAPILKRLELVESVANRAEEICNKIEKENESWKGDFDEREIRIKGMEDRLKKAEAGFNFVGLVKAFVGMAYDKKQDLIKVKDVTNAWKQISIAVPIISSIVIGIWQPSEWWYLLPIFTSLMLSLYFFRVSLLEEKSIKSQLAQIELRRSLCQFIQEYAEYSSEIKDKDHNPLQKFEDLIFSGIVMKDEQIPSTFDGMDQINKMLKNIGKGNG